MRQVIAVTLLNLRNIPSRLGTSLVIVVGIAGVVAVLVSMLAMVRGFDQTLKGTGTDDRAIILAAGVLAELSSTIGRDSVPLLRELPGIRRGADGAARVSAELMVITELKRGVGAQRASVNVALRGVEPAGLSMRPEIRLAEGRLFQPGLREVIVGRAAQQQFEGISVGAKLQFRGSDWTVVGLFDSGRDAHESELWTDADTARGAFGRPVSSSLLVELDGPGGLETLKAAVKNDTRLQVDVQTERDYFSGQSKNFTNNIGRLTGIVATIMAIGALFGALNTMYSAVSSRQTEIATLRAIGFGGAPVIASVLAEAVLLAITGGVLGAVIAYVLFNGMTVSTLGQNFTQVAFSFAVTPELLVRGLVWAVAIGLFGGLLPAIQAARMPVVDALRSA